jgi:hypothetical protein
MLQSSGVWLSTSSFRLSLYSKRRDFHSAFGPPGAAVEEAIQAIGMLAALRDERSILNGDQGVGWCDSAVYSLKLKEAKSNPRRNCRAMVRSE